LILSATIYPVVIGENGMDIGFLTHAKCDSNGFFTSSMFFTKLSAVKVFVKEKAIIEKPALI